MVTVELFGAAEIMTDFLKMCQILITEIKWKSKTETILVKACK